MENIFRKSFDNITSADIQNLINIKYKERQTIEYKREMYENKDEGKREMLRDISSFANAYGGYLIIGIEDKNGIPLKIINVDNAEIEKDRIEKSCLSNIEPHILGLKCKTIQMDSGENVILIFIPRGFRKPHMINFKGLNQFWIRHQDKKMPMSVDEIREACISVVSIWKNVKEFLIERESEIKQEILGRPCFVIGSSPLFLNEDIIDIKDNRIKNFLINPPNQTSEIANLSYGAWEAHEAYPEPTLYGMKIASPEDLIVELFRNGYYELRVPADKILGTQDFFKIYTIIRFSVNYFRALSYLVEYLGIEQTYLGYMSFFNIKGKKFKYGWINPETKASEQKAALWDKQELKIPAKQIVSFDTPDGIAKFYLDKVWNSFGFEEVPHFEDNKYSR
ncbi:MAG: ATP-binding protein [Candidatus Aminicenantes bacterium]|nr:ATP-binding protein [Candidatus Aminicenantes bacterium]